MTITLLSLSGWQFVNVLVHVLAGLIGIALGLCQLWGVKGDAAHRRVGLWFVGATSIVVLCAAIGVSVFRFLPMFAVLTVLVGYQLASGWRDAITQENGPRLSDLVLTLGALAMSVALFPALSDAPRGQSSSSSVVMATLGALLFILAFDLLRWLFPRRWFAKLWLATHLYKMCGALFGMISAFVGNVMVWVQPWSQLLPSVLGTFVIAYWLVRIARTGDRLELRTD
jgi:uncharacterized membrane protein